MDKLDKELETIEMVCFQYKKNKSFVTNLVLSVLEFVFLYIQYYVLTNQIDIGFEPYFVIYTMVCTILFFLFGWIGYFLEFSTINIKIFNIGKIIIWSIELILSIIFLILLINSF